MLIVRPLLFRLAPLVLPAGALASAPAWAAAPVATSAALAALAWFVVGVAVALAALLLLAWRALGDRVVPARAWKPFTLVSVALLLLSLGLAWRWPLVAVLLALPVVAWGLVLGHRLVRRMGRMFEEHDHAHAEVKRAQSKSERDALTGALNRGAWRQRLELLASDASEAQPPRPLSVLFFDIDLFKLINDSLGHGVGDECLKAVSDTVAAELRGGDVLGRMGGEEFAVMLPGAKRTHGIAVGERIRMAIQEHCRVVGEEVVELTVSIGVAEFLGPDEALDALVDRADRAMYSAKDSGRNMVVADAGAPAS